MFNAQSVEMDVSEVVHCVPQGGMQQNKIAYFEKSNIPSTVKLALH